MESKIDSPDHSTSKQAPKEPTNSISAQNPLKIPHPKTPFKLPGEERTDQELIGGREKRKGGFGGDKSLECDGIIGDFEESKIEWKEKEDDVVRKIEEKQEIELEMKQLDANNAEDEENKNNEPIKAKPTEQPISPQNPSKTTPPAHPSPIPPQNLPLPPTCPPQNPAQTTQNPTKLKLVRNITQISSLLLRNKFVKYQLQLSELATRFSTQKAGSGVTSGQNEGKKSRLRISAERVDGFVPELLGVIKVELRGDDEENEDVMAQICEFSKGIMVTQIQVDFDDSDIDESKLGECEINILSVFYLIDRFLNSTASTLELIDLEVDETLEENDNNSNEKTDKVHLQTQKSEQQEKPKASLPKHLKPSPKALNPPPNPTQPTKIQSTINHYTHLLAHLPPNDPKIPTYQDLLSTLKSSLHPSPSQDQILQFPLHRDPSPFLSAQEHQNLLSSPTIKQPDDPLGIQKSDFVKNGQGESLEEVLEKAQKEIFRGDGDFGV